MKRSFWSLALFTGLVAVLIPSLNPGYLNYSVVSAGPPPTPSAIPIHIIPSTYQFGSYGTRAQEMLDPAGLLIDDNHHIYISDCALDRIQVYAEDGAFVRTISEAQPDLVNTKCPRGMALTPDGKLLVVEEASRRVQVYDPTSSTFVKTLIADSRLISPYAVATNGKMIVISDPGSNSIHFYTRDGTHVSTCGTAGEAPGNFLVPLGITLDADGNAYVADQQNARIQHLRSDCSVVRLWGQYGSMAGQFAEPSDVRFVQGVVYVADLTNHRLQAFRPNGDFLYQWGHHPSKAHEGHGYTHYPMFIAIDPQATVAVVCEPFEIRCQVFDLATVRTHVSLADESAFWAKFPRFHYGTGIEPVTAEIKDQATGTTKQFYGAAIAEPDISQVVILDWTGDIPKVHATIGGFGSQPGMFRQPSGMVFDTSKNELYVSDSHNNRIQVFTLDGQFVRSFGTFGLALGSMNGPAGLDFDEAGNLLVAQAHADRIDVFTKQGDYLRSYGHSGSGSLEFNLPLGIAYNSRLNRIYVDDTYNHRVQILSQDGRYISEFGGRGTEPGQLNDSIQLAIDTDNNIYVTDTSTNRVLKFNQDGSFLKEWGSWGSEVGQFYKPKGIGVLRDRLLVIDFGNHRGQIFTFDGQPLGVFGEGVLSPVSNTAGIFTPTRTNSEPMTTNWLIIVTIVSLLIAVGTIIYTWRYRRTIYQTMSPILVSNPDVRTEQQQATVNATNGNGYSNGQDIDAPLHEPTSHTPTNGADTVKKRVDARE